MYLIRFRPCITTHIPMLRNSCLSTRKHPNPSFFHFPPKFNYFPLSNFKISLACSRVFYFFHPESLNTWLIYRPRTISNPVRRVDYHFHAPRPLSPLISTYNHIACMLVSRAVTSPAKSINGCSSATWHYLECPIVLGTTATWWGAIIIAEVCCCFTYIFSTLRFCHLPRIMHVAMYLYMNT